jgi:hypothetical protein
MLLKIQELHKTLGISEDEEKDQTNTNTEWRDARRHFLTSDS